MCGVYPPLHLCEVCDERGDAPLCVQRLQAHQCKSGLDVQRSTPAQRRRRGSSGRIGSQWSGGWSCFNCRRQVFHLPVEHDAFLRVQSLAQLNGRGRGGQRVQPRVRHQQQVEQSGRRTRVLMRV